MSTNRKEQLALDLIADILSGKEWSPDTLDSISQVIRLTGREIKDSADNG